jgi:hypothetical protein
MTPTSLSDHDRSFHDGGGSNGRKRRQRNRRLTFVVVYIATQSFAWVLYSKSRGSTHLFGKQEFEMEVIDYHQQQETPASSRILGSGSTNPNFFTASKDSFQQKGTSQRLSPKSVIYHGQEISVTNGIYAPQYTCRTIIDDNGENESGADGHKKIFSGNVTIPAGPSVILVGSQKCGTTALRFLWNYIHPQFIAARNFETHFFDQ